MADPATILGLISASLTTTMRAATIGKDLHTLRQKFKATNARVQQLSIHVAAIRVAARSLSSWLESEAVGSEEVEEVRHELLQVLSACCDLLSDLQDHFARALAGGEAVSFKGTFRYVWDEDLIKETVETLHHQETTLVLMLQTLGQLTRLEQADKLREETVIWTLAKAKRPSTSIFGLHDGQSNSQPSYLTQTSEYVDVYFNFDMEVLASTAYRSAFTSFLRRNTRKRKEPPARSISTRMSIDSDAESFDDLESTVTKVQGDDDEETSHPIVDLTPYNRIIEDKQKLTDIAACTYCRALFDYRSEKPSLLSFSQGDEIIIVHEHGSGWNYGVLDERRGWFRSNYCFVRPYIDGKTFLDREFWQHLSNLEQLLCMSIAQTAITERSRSFLSVISLVE